MYFLGGRVDAGVGVVDEGGVDVVDVVDVVDEGGEVDKDVCVASWSSLLLLSVL